MTNLIINSEIVQDSVANNIRYVTEKHTFSDATTLLHSYSLPSDLDANAVLLLRAENINKSLTHKAEVEALATNYEIPLFKAEFRDKFTTEEQIAIDSFNDNYKTLSTLTPELKASILSALEYYKDATKVYLSHPKTIAFVNMYEALGIIAPGRATEVLSYGG